MNKTEIMKMLYAAIADKKTIEPTALWDCVSKHLKSAPKNNQEFNEVWDEIVALTNELAENAFTAGFNAALEVTRG